MAAQIEVITGIAGSGKTARLLEIYRGELLRAAANATPGTALWLTPTHRSRRTVLEALLDGVAGGLFAPNVFTFDEFAERILQSSGDDVQPLSSVMRRMLVRQIIDRLQRNGRLSYFGPIAQTSGFLDLAITFIAELKREETWPEHFSEACQGRGERAKDRELALIYTEYQEELHRLALYDAEGRFWSARTVLEREIRGAFSDLSLVVVDGFTDFTFTQYEILGLLRPTVDRIIIGLQVESEVRRPDLFARTIAVRDRLLAMAGSPEQPTVCHLKPPADAGIPAFQHIARNLFANPRQVEPSDDATGVEVLTVTGQRGEVETLAARIKKLLLGGTLAEDIVVAFRSLPESVDLVREVFSAAGIPFWCESGTLFSRTPLMKAVFTILQLELDNWPFDRLMGLLDSAYFRPKWAEWSPRFTPRAVAFCLRRLKLDGGRAAILQALERVSTRDDRNGAPESDSNGSDDSATDEGRSLELAACAFLSRLSRQTEVLRRPADVETWAERIVSLVRGLGMAPSDRQNAELPRDVARLNERDQRVWDSFERMLFEAARAERAFGGRDRPLSLKEFAALLADLLHAQQTSPSGSERGCVRVLSAPQVRNLEVPHLFLAGLTETSFPQSRGDDCLYSELERRELNLKGLSLRQRSSQSQDEMLLFYGVVTRARRSLVLSYPSVSAAGQPLFPSPYLTTLSELFKPGAVKTDHVMRLDPVVPCAEVLSPAEFRVAATVAVLEKHPGLFRALFDDSETKETARNILAAVALDVARFHTHGFTRFEGRLGNAVNVKRLQEHFDREYQFSTTQLESYAHCPFQFFLYHVLKIAPLESPEIATDYRQRGVLVHEILTALHAASRADEEDETADGAAGLTERFRQLVEDRIGRQIPSSELQRALGIVEQRLLSDWAEAYGDQWKEYADAFGTAWDSPPTPVHLETAFGDVPGDGGDASERAYDSLVFGSGTDQTHVRGRIDRIDVGRVEGQTVFNVIDYKTGSPESFALDKVKSGRSLQLALYTLAVARLGLVAPDATPFQMGYWAIREAGFVAGLKQGRKKSFDSLDQAMLDSLQTLLDELIPRLAQRIRTGAFPVFSQDDDCTRLCAYNTVCRVGQMRPLRERLEKQVLQ